MPGHGKQLIEGPCPKIAEALLSLRWNQLRIANWSPHRVLWPERTCQEDGAYDEDLNCRQWGRGTKTAFHVLCECEVLDHKLQQLFKKPRLEAIEFTSLPGPEATFRKKWKTS
nr:unnamed protein product [Callosobruchus chinensis]